MQFILTNIPLDVEIQWQLTVTRFHEWIEDDIFSFNWWTLLILFLLCFYIWWKLTDKSRLNEIILYAGFITIMILILDELGEELSLWDYTTDLFPVFPPITAIDLSCMPMVYSLIYQCFRTWKSFIIATLVMATIFCFICEPIFVWSGVYQMLKWKSYYGFPIYISLSLISKAAVTKIYSISKSSKGRI